MKITWNGIIIGIILTILSGFFLRNCNSVKKYITYTDTIYIDTGTVLIPNIEPITVIDTIINNKIKWKYDTIIKKEYIDTSYLVNECLQYKQYYTTGDTNDIIYRLNIGLYANQLDTFSLKLANKRPIAINKVEEIKREVLYGAHINIGPTIGAEANLLYKNKKNTYISGGIGFYDKPYVKLGIYKEF